MALCTRRSFLWNTLKAGVAACGGCSVVLLTDRSWGQPPASDRKTVSRPLYPVDACVGPRGAIYISDSRGHSVWKWDQGQLRPLYVGSSRYRTPLYRAWDLAPLGEEELVVSDPGTMDIWALSLGGELRPFSAVLVRPEEDQQLPLREQRFAGSLDKPMAVAVDRDGTVLVADLGLHALLRFEAPGRPPVKVADVAAPRGLTIDKDGSYLVVSHGTDQLIRVRRDGKVAPVVQGSLAPEDIPSFPHQVLVMSDGHYVVSDGYARTLWLVDSGGKVQPLHQGPPLLNPVGLGQGPSDQILVADPHAGTVFVWEKDGKLRPLY
jgi:sugar lactone lactonase YvrE